MPSLYFLHATTGWLALLGLAVPLAIYLWNRRPGRVVQVGSLRWLEAAANRRLRSLKPEQLLLFLLRAAILSLLALALAGPTQHLPAPARRGQVLLGPTVTLAALAPVRPVLDSLRRRGYELRQVRPEQALGPTLAWTALGLGPKPTAAPAGVNTLPSPRPAAPLNLWSAVQQVADSLPGRPLVVVAPLTLTSFSGTRPALPAAVRWLPLPGPDSVRWPVAAWRPRPDSLVLLVAEGTETGVTLRRVRRAWPARSGALAGLAVEGAVRVDVARATLSVTENGHPRPVPLLTRPLRLLISYDAAHAASARVLAAGLRAAGSLLPLAPELSLLPTAPDPATPADWLFWLREAPVPAAWTGRLHREALQLWQEAPAAAPKLATTFLPAANAAPAAVFRLDTTATPAGGAPVWLTGAGHPLLTVQYLGRGRRYQLRTRLDAAWSELAESPELPTLLLPLLLPSFPTSPLAPDPRRLDLRQVQAAPLASAPLAGEPAAPTRDLTPWLVLGAGVLFGLERLLAAYQARRTAPTLVAA